MYIVKTNYPMAMHDVAEFKRKRDAMRRFARFQRFFDKNRNPYKLFIRNDGKKPLRGRIQVEYGGFYYYVELFKKAK
jgi:hypothetical protein